MFQSSPSPKAGSYSCSSSGRPSFQCFNPLPARRPGATFSHAPRCVLTLMFQSSPSPKAGSYCALDVYYTLALQFQSSPSPKAGSYNPILLLSFAERVSILSQPEGRELRSPERVRLILDMFQSSPSPKAGSYKGDPEKASAYAKFQSSPSPKAGSYQNSCPAQLPSHQVSILSQPEGRELLEATYYGWGASVFQSSPSPKAGSYFFDPYNEEAWQCFNPLPARRPGATKVFLRLNIVFQVSILSQPEGRELREK